jgi:hypothetical protein
MSKKERKSINLVGSSFSNVAGSRKRRKMATKAKSRRTNAAIKTGARAVARSSR